MQDGGRQSWQRSQLLWQRGKHGRKSLGHRIQSAFQESRVPSIHAEEQDCKVFCFGYFITHLVRMGLWTLDPVTMGNDWNQYPGNLGFWQVVHKRFIQTTDRVTSRVLVVFRVPRRLVSFLIWSLPRPPPQRPHFGKGDSREPSFLYLAQQSFPPEPFTPAYRYVRANRGDGEN